MNEHNPQPCDPAETSPKCAVGSPAPAFALNAVSPDLKPIRVSLADYRTRWLAMLFYPRDFSFVCPTELTGFSAEKVQFDQRNCELLGVSIDTIRTHLSWLETGADAGGVEGLRFPLASDPGGDVCKAYGLWRAHDGLPNRGLLLVDPGGILRYYVVFDIAVGRSVDDVLRVLDALQAGGLCPANWKRADGVLDVGSLLQPGRVLGHYRIERELGIGAFGRVLAADDIRLGRKVALKVLARQSDASEQRLLEEARMAAQVNHPNVCTVYAVDVIDTLPTIVMEYINGQPLSKAIVGGLSADRFRSIASQLAMGLAAAHEQGVVHGDIKPGNVLLRAETDPVLVDFGLARQRMEVRKVVEESPAGKTLRAESISSLDSTVDLRGGKSSEMLGGAKEAVDMNTTAGEHRLSSFPDSAGISGTLAYMSPEQARGEILSEASDLFSLGLLFVEMLGGETPLSRLNPIQILRDLQDDSFLDSIPDNLPEAERALLTDLFSPAPENRPTAKELALRLE